jgi:hypothetical protein
MGIAAAVVQMVIGRVEVVVVTECIDDNILGYLCAWHINNLFRVQREGQYQGG